jgi:F420-dependent oxidoreductase-like protein
VKIGLHIADFTYPGGPAGLADDLTRIAVTAEDQGFARVSVMDHLFQIGMLGPPEHEMLEAYTTLGFLAARTSRVELLAWVTAVTYRRPGMLAKLVGTLDVLSRGRSWLGIGAGWNEEESGAYGIALCTPRERSDRFEEACAVLVGLLTQETTTFDGTYYQLTDARCEPKAVQQPHPPICIGGSGEKRTLRTTARYAQHWNFGGGTPEEFAQKRDVLYAHCADLGRDPKQITLSSHVRLDPDGNVAAVAEAAAALGAVGLDLAVVYLPPEQQQPAVLGPLADALAPLA